MTVRKEFSRRTKLQAVDRCRENGGLCECGCGLPIDWVKGCEFNHEIPAEHDGPNTLENCQVVRKDCHKKITRAQAKQFAKDRKIRARATGARTPKRRLPGGRDSGIKIKLSGGFEPR